MKLKGRRKSRIALPGDGSIANIAPPLPGEVADTKAKASDLLDEQGFTSIASVRSPHRKSEADRLTADRLARMIIDADMGHPRALLTLAEEMEEREPQYRTVLATRKLAVAGSPMRVESASDSDHDQAIADDIEQAITSKPEFEGLVLDLMDGVPKGFSAVETMWLRDARRWEPAEYRFREQRHFVFDRDTMSMPALLNPAFGPYGEPLLPFKWLVHRPKLISGVPIRAGLARTIAICYAAKRFTVADWAAFLEVFGMPIRVGKFPANMASQKAELLKAVRAIGSDAAAVIPAEMNIEFIETKSGASGTTLFRESAEYWDKMISKVVLGQTMTTDDGSSLAQAKTHDEVRNDILRADQRAIAATINRDLIKPFVDLNYGTQKVYPKLAIGADDPEDTTALMNATKLFVDMGGKVQMSEIRDRLGLAEPEEGAELLTPAAIVATSALAAQRPDGKPQGDAQGAQGGTKSPNGGKGAPSGKGAKDAPVEDDKASKSSREANSRQAFARLQGTEDVVDVLEEQRLKHWRPLLDENVGALVKRVQDAGSWDEARAALEQLANDQGEHMALGLVTAQLARATFQARGIGDATDQTEDV